MRKLQLTCFISIFSALNLIAWGTEQLPSLNFSRHILPILSDNCFSCHGPDESHRKAKLRLDTREAAIVGTKGRPAIVPGDITQGTFLERIRTTDDDEVMPPTDSHRKRLSPTQIALIERWIKAGAEWGGHWAFTPPVRPVVPAGTQNPIDAFIRAQLVHETLTPAPPAAASSIARRLSYTLTGLPPTAEQVAKIATGADGARAVVEQLFKSPHYGERMAMWWLDAARYADTDGFQADATRNNWPWRDWVIDAFNHNMPFNQFTIEQLAGDLLPNATPEQQLATCFNRNHMCNGEGGRHPEESRVDYVRDRVNTTGSVWMGLTMSCAQCHTHKFDPITHHDYYAFSAFFNSIDEDGKAGKDAKPFLSYASSYVERSLQEANQLFEQRKASEEVARHAAEKPFISWLEQRIVSTPTTFHSWQNLTDATFETDEGTSLLMNADAVVQASGKHPNQDVYRQISKVSGERITGIRLEIFPHESHTNGRYSRGKDGYFVLTDVKVQVRRETSSQIRDIIVKNAIADMQDDAKKHNGYGAIKGILDDDPRNGWSTRDHDASIPHTAILALEEPLTLTNDEVLIIELQQRSTLGDANIGRFRLSVTAEAGPAIQELGTTPLEQLATAKGKISDAQRKRLKQTFLTDYQPYVVTKQAYDRAKSQRDDIAKANKVNVMVMAERKEPRTTNVLLRGVWDAKGDVVVPRLPPAFGAWTGEKPLNRLDMARWLVAPEHPLTARVFVNHLWQLCFGRGLVRTVDDFGLQGEQPSHPELLDWLAVECIENNWNTQHILGLIVSSQTFQQRSMVDAATLARDPGNQFLARGARYRLPSWMLRDNALAAAGLLNAAIGGPPVYPYQPDGVWEELFMGRYRYNPSEGPAQYRRTIYAFWRRTIAPTFLFDNAQRRSCDVQHHQTNTPLQALTLLNDTSYLESAYALARLASTASDDEASLQIISNRIMARPLRADELPVFTRLLTKTRAYYQANHADARSLLTVGQQLPETTRDPTNHAAFMIIASTFLNLDEVLTYE